MKKEINVLILDDEKNILSSLERLFFNEPFAIFTTTSKDEAIEVLKKENIKLVMSDQRMPDISGVKFLQEVREKSPDTIRILFTGHTDVKTAEDAINLGKVYRFINKPWNSNELKASVLQAINHFDLIKENQMFMLNTKIKNEELEILNRKLKNVIETQKEFTSTVSHELRTPLASIKSTVDLVLSKAPGELTDDQEKFLNKTKNNVDRLSRLINDILDLTKLEEGKSQLNLNFANINDLITEVIDIQKNVAQAKGLNLKSELAQDIPQVPFDSDKLHQVFNNLINNAIKFTDAGEITVRCVNHQDNNHIQISISDTGKGIEKNDQNKLFQKFQQLGDSTKNVGGTGLGLAICKEIIERHGGKIWIESEIGKGCTFYFLLPIQERRKEQL